MRVVHVLRKPLSEGTVASNVLKHGCGGLNIDASRVGSGIRLQAAAGGIGDGNIYGSADEYVLGRGRDYRVGGRWPANVILQHLDGCRCDGTVRTDIHVGFADEDGKESVVNWICAEGCPVAALDEQTGVLPSGHRPNRVVGQKTKQGPTHFGQINALGVTHKDKGGASRFFKQVGGQKDE